MFLSLIYDKIVSTSPYIELLIRNLYWRNIKKIGLKSKLRAAVSISSVVSNKVDFNKILLALDQMGVRNHKIVIIHSSYDVLITTNLSPKQIVDELIDFVGPNVTLAMPVIRKFDGEPAYSDTLNFDYSKLKRTYDVKHSPVTSGLLPFFLMRRKDSQTSLMPFNPLTAVGPLAEKMMEHNLEGRYPSPHGANSCWKYCSDHDCVIVHLGVDPVHYMTMIHTLDETEDWVIHPQQWYDKCFFTIKTMDLKKEIVVYNRKMKWGLLHYAEKTLRKVLFKSDIIKHENIDGVDLYVTNATDFRNVILQKRKSIPTFPYYLCT